MSDQTMSDRLREALDGVLVDDDGVVHFPAHRGKARGQAAIVAAARRFLALTETGPDYEAAAARVFEVHGYSYLDWPPKWDAAADKHRREARYIVDAALADYLTEEETK